jgi:hypothetical protein
MINKSGIYIFIQCQIFMMMFLLSSSYMLSQNEINNSEKKTILNLIDEHIGPVIWKNHPDVLSSKNRSGFETGQVVKLDSIYHMFVNEMFDRPHRDMRISHWVSKDAIHWARQSTISESIPGRSPFNPRSELWLTAVEFNEDENAWNIFYVAYRAGDKAKGEIEGNDYEGRIWRARSVIKGFDGIFGPYADMGIVLQPDENSQAWEGQQAVASFNPYKVGDMWYAFYDGHNHVPRGTWPSGMASAPKLEGLWERMPAWFNPVPIAEVFIENTVITELKDGRFLMVFDSLGDREIAPTEITKASIPTNFKFFIISELLPTSSPKMNNNVQIRTLIN